MGRQKREDHHQDPVEMRWLGSWFGEPHICGFMRPPSWLAVGGG